MSVSSMAEQAQNNADAPKNSLSLLAAYIPSEAIALYIAALGILMPASNATEDQVVRIRLICFLLGLAAAVFISVAGVDADQARNAADTPKKRPWDAWAWFEPFRRRLVVAVLAVVAFAFYAAATPSFFYSNTYLTIQFTQWAAAGAIVCALALPTVAKWLGVRARAA